MNKSTASDDLSLIESKQKQEVFCKRVSRNHQCQSLFLNKVAGLLLHSCFPVNFAKLLRTPFLQKTYGCCFCKNFFVQCSQYTKQLISWKNFKWEQKHHFSVKCTFLEKKHSPEVFYKEKLVIKILQNPNKNTSLSESLFYKICRSQVCNFINNETPTQKFLRAPFSQNISERLLLFFQKTKSIFFSYQHCHYQRALSD